MRNSLDNEKEDNDKAKFAKGQWFVNKNYTRYQNVTWLGKSKIDQCTVLLIHVFVRDMNRCLGEIINLFLG